MAQNSFHDGSGFGGSMVDAGGFLDGLPDGIVHAGGMHGGEAAAAELGGDLVGFLFAVEEFEGVGDMGWGVHDANIASAFTMGQVVSYT